MEHLNSAGMDVCSLAVRVGLTDPGGRAVADQVAKDLGDENTKSHDRRMATLTCCTCSSLVVCRDV